MRYNFDTEKERKKECSDNNNEEEGEEEEEWTLNYAGSSGWQ